MKHLKKTAIQILVGSTLIVAAVSAQASQIGTRAELNNLLGSNQVLEDFESFHIDYQYRYSDGPLNYDTTVGSLGNHLVKQGITFQRNPDYAITNTGYRGIDLNPINYFGSTSQSVSGAGGGGGASIRNDFQILFTTAVTAFGMDVLAYSGFASDGIISVYDVAGALLGETAFNGAVGGHFFGWESAAGIGKITIHDNPNASYMQFDNIGFGVATVPVPGAVWLFGSALAGLGLFGKRKQQA